MKRKDEKVMSEKFNVADIFGENVFNDTVMKERLPKNVYKNLKLAIAGVEFIYDVDKEAFRSATAGLVTEYRNKYTGVAALLDRIDEIRKGE